MFDTSPHATAIATPTAPPPQTFRTVWRTKVHPGGIATTMLAGTDARIIHFGVDLSGDLAAWVEHRPLPEDADPENGTTFELHAFATGDTIPEGLDHIASISDLATATIRHLYGKTF